MWGFTYMLRIFIPIIKIIRYLNISIELYLKLKQENLTKTNSFNFNICPAVFGEILLNETWCRLLNPIDNANFLILDDSPISDFINEIS